MSDDQTTLPVRMARAVEQSPRLDRLVHRLEPVADRFVASPRVADLLRGRWQGHAVHPLLTDLPIGSFVCTSLLDLTGGRAAAPGADRLLAVGLLAAPPTIATGWAEWTQTAPGSRRVGAVDAVGNAVALAAYAGSLLARRLDRRRLGVRVLGHGRVASRRRTYHPPAGGRRTKATPVRPPRSSH